MQVAQDTCGATIDVLVSNAAVNPAAGPILQMADSAVDKILDINVKSAVLLARAVAPHMPKVSAALQSPHTAVLLHFELECSGSQSGPLALRALPLVRINND